MNNAQTAIQQLPAGATLTEQFIATSVDGSKQVLTMTITGTNDAARIGGVLSGSVTEDVAEVNGYLMVSGTLKVVDIDIGQAAFIAEKSICGTYGDLTVNTNGDWSYKAENRQSSIQKLSASDVVYDDFKVHSIDGTTQVVRISIRGADEKGSSTIMGTSENDVLFGTKLDDYIIGYSGDDLIEGAGGADRIDGGAGFDITSYVHSTSNVRVDLSHGVGEAGDAKGDILTNIEGAEGSSYADKLIGDSGDNMLIGGGGDDMLSGGAGNDILIDGLGKTDFLGGDGIDTASFEQALGNISIDLSQCSSSSGDKLDSIENLIGTQ
ncbi:MAG: hypothetical protein CTY35_15975, partial [Methylotenera sp.]